MCYPCTMCGACGKYESDLFMLSKAPVLLCSRCGAEIDMATGQCSVCSFKQFDPPGMGKSGKIAAHAISNAS